ncbi:MAG: glutamine synthetase, partial [Chloroflexi bacterium]|nr:glutamine synthetase [Chloroflexota bacterium]
DLGAQVRKEMVATLGEMGVRVETSHHEVAMGQHEIDFQYDTALRTADHVVTLRYALKAVARKHNLHVTFMPKPLYGIAGSGMHTHQSLVRLSDGKNAFFDPRDEYGLSEVARYFIAGQLHHARGMSAVLCPLVNSYKRLVAGYEAPAYITWARINRSALVRVPQIAPSHPEATRLELRSPDPSCNPYLAFAVMLKCGLDGIKKRLPLPAPVEENLYTFDPAELRRRSIGLLPATLGQALEELSRDEVVQEALGEQLYASFLEAKGIEWEDYRRHVSQWELDHYLETF